MIIYKKKSYVTLYMEVPRTYIYIYVYIAFNLDVPLVSRRFPVVRACGSLLVDPAASWRCVGFSVSKGGIGGSPHSLIPFPQVGLHSGIGVFSFLSLSMFEHHLMQHKPAKKPHMGQRFSHLSHLVAGPDWGSTSVGNQIEVDP